MRMSGRSRLVADLAEAQFGVVSWAQLRGLGVPEATIARWAKDGRVARVFPGVYAVGHRVLRQEGRLMAAVLLGGDGAVISHRAAAAWWGLRATTSALIDVTTPHGRRRRAGIRWHRAALAPQDRTVHDGIPIT